MKISVIMTTYNGEKFVLEQLESLRCQERTPDEVLIFDDGSKDKTSEIVTEYIDEHNLKNWKYTVNTVNKGWKRNFYDAAKEATGDVFFPCDQDDIWRKDKLSIMSQILEQNPEVNVLVGRYSKFFYGDTVQPKKNSISIFSVWRFVAKLFDKMEDREKTATETGVYSKRTFGADFLKIEPGCCFCVRKSFFNNIAEEWFEELGHDAHYTFYAKLYDSYYDLDKTVIDWRTYSGSTSKPKGRSKDTRLSELERNERVIEKLAIYVKTHTELDHSSEMLKELLEAKKWNDLRHKFMQSRNPIYGFRLLAYLKYYERNRAYLTDWLYAYMN